MKEKQPKADPFYDICKCGRTRNNVVHCQDCCGWGLTKDLKYHKFVFPKKARSRKKTRRSID